jgi:membrane protein implicated in regulation of membrane protease activity
MFQLVGGLLAFFAIFSAFAGAPFAGTVFALLTFVWVLVAKPGRRERTARDDAPWGAIYQTPFSR